MQSELKELDGLKRELKITLSVEEVKQTYQKHIQQAAKQAKIAGFRPGKVPLDIVEKKYGSAIKNEVAGALMQESFEKVLSEKDIKIVGHPHIHPKQLEKNEPFEYVAEFEVYPEISLKDLTGVKVDKFISEVTDKDLTNMLEKIQRQQAQWVGVERNAKEGDRLLIDFVGTVDQETFEGGAAKDFTLELGSKQMIPGFEEALVGAKLKETTKIKVTFPKDYPAETLAGKESEFEITVHKIEEAQLPEIDDALAKKVGIEEGAEKLKSEVRSGMERELRQAIEARLKKGVLEKLIELNPIDVPTVLLEAEIKNLQRMTKQQMAAQQNRKELPDIDLPKDPYIEQAKKRVMLGLLLGEVIRICNITVDAEKVRAKIEEIASVYPEPKRIVDWYYGNKQLLSEVEALVVEDEAVQKLLEKAEVNEKRSTYDEVVSG